MKMKFCEHCGVEFHAYHKTLRYCSNLCSVRANPKPQNFPKYAITLELLKEADRDTPYGESRLKYVADRVGCTPSAVGYAAKRLGFTWTKRPRLKLFGKTTHVEHKYVRGIGCVVCGEKRIVEAAHLWPCRDGGSGMVENIIPLCPTHHRLYDRGGLSDEENDKFVDFLFVKYPNLREELHSAES